MFGWKNKILGRRGESNEAAQEHISWLKKMRHGLLDTSEKLTAGISNIFAGRKLDAQTISDLEDLLIASDIGPVTAARLVGELQKTRISEEVTPEKVRMVLAKSIAAIMEKVAKPLELKKDICPTVILFVGVNGTGKTTTIGKLAAQFTQQGKRVMLAAGDTFRAAAVEQLKIWGERAGAKVVSGANGADASGVVFDAVRLAIADKADVLLVDTAGRLQNKADLMAELQKVIRVVKKLAPSAPHMTVLTLDATTGQNAISQVQVFKDMVDVTGLIVTKLDGSARGGVLVALAERFGLPIHAIGVGEGLDDMQPFDAAEFADGLLGI